MTKRAIFLVISEITRNLENQYQVLLLALIESGTSAYIINKNLRPIGEQIVYLLALEEKLRIDLDKAQKGCD